VVADAAAKVMKGRGRKSAAAPEAPASNGPSPGSVGTPRPPRL